MKPQSLIITIVITLFAFILDMNAQVGINTPTPNAMLDINSATSGVVFPRVVLTATNVYEPVINPATGNAPVEGTMVYNTNNTFTGTNDVYEGLYIWDGTQWISYFPKVQSELFEQTQTDPSLFGVRVSANGNATVYEDIPGLTNRTFTAKYTGTYKIELAPNYGPGLINTPTNGDVDVVGAQGFFQFTFDGVNYLKYVNATSFYTTADGGMPQRYFAIFKQVTYIIYVDLVAGQDYDFNLAFDQMADDRLLNSGDSGDGRGIVGVTTPSYIQISYIDD